MAEYIKDGEEAKGIIKPVYEDLAKPTVKEVGSVLGRMVHNLLFPVRGLCWGFEKIEHVIMNGLEKRLENVPQEKLQTPLPEIAVPLVQALTYTAQNDSLREMYLNLLANSMNSDLDKVIHPSYIEIIKQMNHLDALVFTKLVETPTKFIKAITPNVMMMGQNMHFTNAMPFWFLGWTVETYDIFDISACLIRLSRLGIIELMLERTTGDDGYDELKSSPLITSIFDKYVVDYSDMKLELGVIQNSLYINEFGQQFSKACL
jgi:hypothetical protein